MLAKTELCKQMRQANQSWEPQRHYILQLNGWEIGTNSVSAKDFKKQAKLLQTCYRLYSGTEGDDSAPSDSPYAKDGVFGPPDGGRRSSGGGSGGETRKCNICGKQGHIARNCREKRDPADMKCFRCKEMGHTAKDCDNERVS
jgi:hypothetical protein